MVISMQQFSADGQFATYDPYRAKPVATPVFTLQCRSCGFEPADAVTAPRRCCKCHGTSFERFAKPGSILTNAVRYPR